MGSASLIMDSNDVMAMAYTAIDFIIKEMPFMDSFNIRPYILGASSIMASIIAIAVARVIISWHGIIRELAIYIRNSCFTRH